MVEQFSLNILPDLDEETQEIAKRELRETPENVREAVAELRRRLIADESISFKDDDFTLIAFLRPCKFYVESAFEKMHKIAEFKRKYSDVYENLNVEHLRHLFVTCNVLNVLKDCDHKGRRILVVNSGGLWDPSKVSANELLQLFFVVHELAVLEAQTQVRGVVVIMDFEGLSLKQVAAMTPAFSMKLLGFIQDAMPLRLKEVHMVRQPFMFNVVWKIFKPFIREKLKNRIFFHGKQMSSLHKYLEPSHLPSDYGGELHKIDYSGSSWSGVLEENLSHVNEWNNFGYSNRS